MLKPTKLLIFLLCASLPITGIVYAEEEAPTNKELYQMLLHLQEELNEAKEENARLRAGGVADTYDETKPIGKESIPLNAKLDRSYLTFESADGNVKYTIDGRVMLDTGYIENSKDAADENKVAEETGFRRLRLAVKGKFYKDWSGELDLNFADLGGEDGDVTEVEVKDAWIAYTGIGDNTTIKLGSHKPNFSMDEVTTSRWNNLMEGSMVSDVFSPSRRIGVSVNHWDIPYMLGVSLFGDEYNVSSSDANDSEEYGWSARAVYRPIVSADGGSVLHIGLNLKDEKPQSSDRDVKRTRYRARPEARFHRIFNEEDEEDGTRYLHTGWMDTDSAFTWGAELAGKMGPFSLQAEYMETDVDVIDDPDADFDGWYIKGSWFITGGDREYDLESAEFGRVYPTSAGGDWELVARYSTLDLNDTGAGITGGEATNWTLGLNWYINNNFLVRANYINVNNDKDADGNGDFVGSDDLDLYGMRVQWLF